MSFRPGNREKGWNDPPEFLHNATAETSNVVVSKKTILNQRVAHSFDGKVPSTTYNSNSISDEQKQNEPPKLTAPPPTNSLSTSTENKPTLGEHLTTDNAQIDSMPIEDIENILNSKVQFLKDNQITPRTCEDILKRVKVFIASWSKLKDEVKQRMIGLIKALGNGELSLANQVHVSLMLDFPSEVIQWMVGIKKLIHELIEIDSKNSSKEVEVASEEKINEEISANGNTDKTDVTDEQKTE